MSASATGRLITALATLLLFTACGHKQAKVTVPSPPPIVESQAHPPTDQQPETTKKPKQTEESSSVLSVPPGTKPLLVETGMASWYGAPYHNRRGSNGEVYDMNAMTAAHRTLPLGSLVRVTNEMTGHSAIVRITDRGPFVEGRVLDLSLAAAKAVDVWRAGVAKVRIEVLQTPASLETGGRWAVQIGAFEGEKTANDVADHLMRRYHTAHVLRFSSPVGDWWVRVRVLDDDRKRAEEVARDTSTPEGSIFLVRLD